MEQTEELLENIRTTLTRLLDIEEKRQFSLSEQNNSFDLVLIRNLVVDTTYTSASIFNKFYDYARVFLSATFHGSAIDGVGINIVYNGAELSEEVLRLSKSDGAAAAVSKPIDISHLSGFNLQVENRDVEDVTINMLRITLYNHRK